ncbi:hypothetical protein A9Q99_02225 [Gammaproteobacteria bacterium 45_16_T64]|nr:hypothetical protein A9Q99_02225 [Gammaproteobacteria bacterium 45_16_T64]
MKCKSFGGDLFGWPWDRETIIGVGRNSISTFLVVALVHVTIIWSVALPPCFFKYEPTELTMITFKRLI